MRPRDKQLVALLRAAVACCHSARVRLGARRCAARHGGGGVRPRGKQPAALRREAGGVRS
ncbi:MAG: hypothetical protein HDS13_03975 [Bacteroides sp.]|nr:hypothetical protein [Bacteroides sp.]